IASTREQYVKRRMQPALFFGYVPAVNDSSSTSVTYPPCVEHGVWVPLLTTPPDDLLSLRLKAVSADESHGINQPGVMSFNSLGCSGYYLNQEPGRRVAAAMSAQIGQPGIYG